MYQLTSSSNTLRTTDGAVIPADMRNADYRAYRLWVEQGNTPDPAPPPAPSASIDAQIVALEATQTDRRIRDAAADDAGGSANGRAWLKALNDQIAVLRSQRT